MSIKNFLRSVAAVVAIAFVASNAQSGVFDQPTTTSQTNQIVSGTTPSGLTWAAVSTGTALPVRTSATSAFNGLPGAVVYFNTTNGQLQVDPRGYDLNSVIITFTTGTVNIGGSTPGPFTYATGTTTSAWSQPTGTPRTFPAIQTLTGLPPTTFAARVGTTIGSPLSPALTNTGDVGNIASTGPTGYWNLGWSFPLDLVASGSVGSMALQNFKTIGQNSNANANILGYGLGFCTFQYGINGVIGNQVGAVVPTIAVPEPGTMILAGVGIAAAAGYRSRQRRKQAPALTHEV
jgi:hypothetical protein